MNKKHPAGFWANQLTDDQVKELTKILISKKPKISFSKVANITRENNEINIIYEALRNNCFFRYMEGNCKITDFKLSGGLNYVAFYEYMIEKFGEAYVDDFYIYAEDYMKNNPDEMWSKRLQKLTKAMPAILDSVQHSNKNEIVTEAENTQGV